MKGKELRLEIAQFKLGPCYCFLSVLLAACPLLLIRLQRRHQLWHNTQRLILSRTGPPQPKLLAGSQPSPEGKATLHVLSSIQSRLKLGARGIAMMLCTMFQGVYFMQLLGTQKATVEKQLFHSVNSVFWWGIV